MLDRLQVSYALITTYRELLEVCRSIANDPKLDPLVRAEAMVVVSGIVEDIKQEQREIRNAKEKHGKEINEAR